MTWQGTTSQYMSGSGMPFVNHEVISELFLSKSARFYATISRSLDQHWQKQAIADNLQPQRSKLVGILVESISVHWDLLPPIRVAIPVLDGGSHYIMVGFAMRMEKSLLLRYWGLHDYHFVDLSNVFRWMRKFIFCKFRKVELTITQH